MTEHIKVKAYKRSPAGLSKKKGNKYNAKKCTIDGIKFDSLHEGKMYTALKLAEDEGKITHLECHPSYVLMVDGRRVGKMTLDFRFYDVKQSRFRIVDAKGAPTAKKHSFRFRKKVFEAIYHPWEIEVWTTFQLKARAA